LEEWKNGEEETSPPSLLPTFHPKICHPSILPVYLSHHPENVKIIL
jgi:hypothetical protein